MRRSKELGKSWLIPILTDSAKFWPILGQDSAELDQDSSTPHQCRPKFDRCGPKLANFDIAGRARTSEAKAFRPSPGAQGPNLGRIWFSGPDFGTQALAGGGGDLLELSQIGRPELGRHGATSSAGLVPASAEIGQPLADAGPRSNFHRARAESGLIWTNIDPKSAKSGAHTTHLLRAIAGGRAVARTHVTGLPASRHPSHRLDNSTSAFARDCSDWWVHLAENRETWRYMEGELVRTTAPLTRWDEEARRLLKEKPDQDPCPTAAALVVAIAGGASAAIAGPTGGPGPLPLCLSAPSLSHSSTPAVGHGCSPRVRRTNTHSGNSTEQKRLRPTAYNFGRNRAMFGPMPTERVLGHKSAHFVRTLPRIDQLWSSVG